VLNWTAPTSSEIEANQSLRQTTFFDSKTSE